MSEMTSENHTRNEAKEVKQCNVATIQSPWLKQSQARVYLQISATTLSSLIATGEIRAVRRGNTVFMHTSWLDQYMLSQPSAAKVPAALVG
jgi:excisionase family DNA binding protein